MLEVTTPGNEERLGIDFAAIFEQSSLCRFGTPFHIFKLMQCQLHSLASGALSQLQGEVSPYIIPVMCTICE